MRGCLAGCPVGPGRLAVGPAPLCERGIESVSGAPASGSFDICLCLWESLCGFRGQRGARGAPRPSPCLQVLAHPWCKKAEGGKRELLKVGTMPAVRWLSAACIMGRPLLLAL